MEPSLLVVVPCHEGDVALAEKNLQRAIKLEAKSDCPCLIVFEKGTDIEKLKSLAQSHFASVVTYEVQVPVKGWPQAKNSAFQSTARYVYRKHSGPWLWWEPDAVPLRKGWLGEIAKAYAGAGKDFLGHMDFIEQMDCVGVYPHNLIEISRNIMLCRAAPWDQVGREDIKGKVAHSDLFQVVWDINGFPVTFNDVNEANAIINKEAVLFHRCKDGSLPEVLSEGFVAKVLKPIAKHFERPRQSDTCIVMLGRYGDIINVLPVAQHLAPDNATVNLMVQEGFSDLLEGVSYVKPILWKGSFTDAVGAINAARGKFSKVLCAQVNGRNLGLTTECDSFSVESWRQMGHLDKWGKLPLTFDRRDERREAFLAAHYLKGDKPNLLVNLSGKSSPYLPAKDLMTHLNAKWSKQFNIVDMSAMRAERLYDLLGLFDRSSLLITIDTSTLHLAAASQIPVICLIADKPSLWHGSRPRCNSILTMRYRESVYRFSAIDDAIISGGQTRTGFSLVHLYSDYEGKGDSLRRKNVAKLTWKMQYDRGGWKSAPVQDCILPRMMDDGKRKVPYIKDLITEGMKHAEDSDVIVLTNDDTCFINALGDRLRERFRHADCSYSFRRDFVRIDRPLPDQAVAGGMSYPGSDLFAFRKSWWQKHESKYPDLCLGAEAWDWCMRVLMEKTCDGRPVAFNDIIYHERHDSMWERADCRHTLPSQQHNRRLSKPFLLGMGVNTHGIL